MLAVKEDIGLFDLGALHRRRTVLFVKTPSSSRRIPAAVRDFSAAVIDEQADVPRERRRRWPPLALSAEGGNRKNPLEIARRRCSTSDCLCASLGPTLVVVRRRTRKHDECAERFFPISCSDFSLTWASGRPILFVEPTRGNTIKCNNPRYGFTTLFIYSKTRVSLNASSVCLMLLNE